MAIKCILFDLYGTLINIDTDENMEEIYRAIAHFLNYRGIDIHRMEIKNLYYEIMKRQRRVRNEQYSEIDVEAIWRELIIQKGSMAAKGFGSMDALTRTLSELYRGISRKRLELYPDVIPSLDKLKMRYPLALVSDAQPCFALPEMQLVGLNGFFSPIVISAHYGYRKPDRRLFLHALVELKVEPSEAIYIGNDMFRDIYGANQLGIKTIFFQSNQGQQTHPNTEPLYIARSYPEILKGVEFLSGTSLS
jgi:putative hydrolase of the HAD superfamily